MSPALSLVAWFRRSPETSPSNIFMAWIDLFSFFKLGKNYHAIKSLFPKHHSLKTFLRNRIFQIVIVTLCALTKCFWKGKFYCHWFWRSMCLTLSLVKVVFSWVSILERIFSQSTTLSYLNKRYFKECFKNILILFFIH